MQAILRLVKDYAARASEHSLGNFLTSMRRQTVHEYGIALCHRKELFVYLVRTHKLYSLSLFVLLAHAHPYVRNSKLAEEPF